MGMEGLLGAGANALNMGIQNAYNRQQDQKSRDWEQQVWHKNWQDEWDRYYQKRADDREILENQRAYDYRMWQQQNQYNEQQRDNQRGYDSPEQQMERFKKAGLNPNLIYGQMGNGSAPISSSSMHTATQADAANRSGSPYHSAQFSHSVNLSNPIADYMSIEQQKAQTDNVRATTKAIEQKTSNDTLRSFGIELENSGKYMDNQKRQILLGKYESILEHQLQAQEANTRNTETRTTVLQHEDSRASRRLTADLLHIGKQMAHMDADIQLKEVEKSLKIAEQNGINIETYIKNFDQMWKERGVNQKDNYIMRSIQEMLYKARRSMQGYNNYLEVK